MEKEPIKFEGNERDLSKGHGPELITTSFAQILAESELGDLEKESPFLTGVNVEDMQAQFSEYRKLLAKEYRALSKDERRELKRLFEHLPSRYNLQGREIEFYRMSKSWNELGHQFNAEDMESIAKEVRRVLENSGDSITNFGNFGEKESIINDMLSRAKNAPEELKTIDRYGYSKLPDAIFEELGSKYSKVITKGILNEELVAVADVPVGEDLDVKDGVYDLGSTIRGEDYYLKYFVVVKDKKVIHSGYFTNDLRKDINQNELVLFEEDGHRFLDTVPKWRIYDEGYQELRGASEVREIISQKTSIARAPLIRRVDDLEM